MQRTTNDDMNKFDGFIQERIKKEGLEQPSINFTNTVISKIEAEKQSNRIEVYKPLINRKVWLAIAGTVLAVFAFLFYGNSVITYNWWPERILLKWENMDMLDKMPEVSVSNIYVYACVGLAFFVGLQIVLLKNHFNKRYFLK
ncbi:MAG: hypothetical protein WBM98_00300 [Maribacter sp.]|uniref:hypothetical protein n=1 Tax=Maribacter sp. TaxID=1897614 RepID=UPI003C786CA0